MEAETKQSKNSKRINRLVKLLVFPVVFLIVGNIMLWIAADYVNHPYLFFLKDLIAWITGINPLLILLLLLLAAVTALPAVWGRTALRKQRKRLRKRSAYPERSFLSCSRDCPCCFL
ncbi:hypothetical protein [Porcincola intestinalis]|uniref:Uncharacterized protein n=1 Tax=Porcincola intestinalis TaxID=2606632 RepID=A0A6L5XBS3_9FIRM|nr:hypothetical protein [Porcincola intestinalis]MSS15942.1 hypothetical protein [Porcincola intestinalis]